MEEGRPVIRGCPSSALKAGPIQAAVLEADSVWGCTEAIGVPKGRVPAGGRQGAASSQRPGQKAREHTSFTKEPRWLPSTKDLDNSAEQRAISECPVGATRRPPPHTPEEAAEPTPVPSSPPRARGGRARGRPTPGSDSLLVLMHREALLAEPVSLPPSLSTVAFTSSLLRDSFPSARIFMLASGLSGREAVVRRRGPGGPDRSGSPRVTVP